MVYNLRTIFFAVGTIAFLIMFILAIIGTTVIKYKKILANITMGLLAVCCISTVGLLISDAVYRFKARSCIKAEYTDAHNFSDFSIERNTSMFKSDGFYYKWKYDAKTNTIIVNKINSDSSKELKDAL